MLRWDLRSRSQLEQAGFCLEHLSFRFLQPLHDGSSASEEGSYAGSMIADLSIKMRYFHIKMDADVFSVHGAIHSRTLDPHKPNQSDVTPLDSDWVPLSWVDDHEGECGEMMVSEFG